jgi:hypothetical protein
MVGYIYSLPDGMWLIDRALSVSIYADYKRKCPAMGPDTL